jgi:hypothetical protein
LSVCSGPFLFQRLPEAVAENEVSSDCRAPALS